VFVDIRTDTLNIDERLVEAAITPRTKAIVAVHYAGVACQMDVLFDIASRRNLILIEDAAQAFASTWNGRPLGGLGQLSAISFHETKNVISGEGGALIVNDPQLISRAEILWEKGTDRVRFQRGEIGKYSWVDVGSSYLPSEVTAAFLWAQLEDADPITRKRLSLWNAYDAKCADIPCLRRPVIPAGCTHNAHMFHVLLAPNIDRATVLQALNSQGVNAVFHYVPLHSSPAGRRLARTASGMEVTDDCSARLMRLPLWTDMTADLIDTVVDTVREVLATQR
jgi:dTDP-4-amino-4,6-dideoxygalactose transaminase